MLRRQSAAEPVNQQSIVTSSPMFSRLQDLLPKEMNRRGFAGIVNAAQVCHEFEQLLPEIFPAEFKVYIAPKSFQNGILTLGVKDGAWAKIILDHKAKIMEKMNEKLGKNTVQQVKTQVTDLAETLQENDNLLDEAA